LLSKERQGQEPSSKRDQRKDDNGGEQGFICFDVKGAAVVWKRTLGHGHSLSAVPHTPLTPDTNFVPTATEWFLSPKMLNSAKGAHMKSMSIFEANEHLQDFPIHAELAASVRTTGRLLCFTRVISQKGGKS
jgi:hypothetical protein